MEVIEEVIVEAIGLEMEGINFFRDRKILDGVIEEFT